MQLFCRSIIPHCSNRTIRKLLLCCQATGKNNALASLQQQHSSFYATETKNRKSENSSITSAAKESQSQHDVSTDVRPLGERIKENTKTASYMGVIVLGVTVTGALFYAIFRELWSANSPNNVYSSALDRCVNDTRIQDALGAPIKGYGEESRRRRRQHVAHTVFERNGVTHMRMQFYVQGIRNKATVHLEMKQVHTM